ncbi:MAG TPA: glycosyltransferase family 4 protein [Pyrinomonadaceae bacterium]|jgi:glycosyltransferase involved in cell wall biosynthesis
MKILFYNHTGKVSGAERILLLALKKINRNRFEPLVVCPASDTLAEEVGKLGISCKSLDRLEARFTFRVDFLLKYLFSFYQTIKQLRREILAENPNLIHANSVRAGLVASAASVGTPVPVFWHLHDEMPRHPLSTAIRWFVAFSSRTHLISTCRKVADSFRGTILRFFGKRIPLRIVENAIEIEKFAPDPRNRQRIREELNLSEDEFVIGIVGLITPRKGQLGLIRAYAQAQKEMPASALLIVGAPMFNDDELYLKELEKCVESCNLENRVRFLGLRKDVAAIMQSLDVLVINSKSEALVIVAIEAMACGTPIIATTVGGIKEMIEHQVNGWLIPFGDERLLYEALVSLSRQPELRRKFSENGRKIVESRLHADRFIKELEDFFSEYGLESDEKGKLVLVEQ